jgi:hypothetical protein
VGIGAPESGSEVVKTPIQTLRFFDIVTTKCTRYWDLTTLTTLEVHDCGKPNQVLKNVATSTTGLLRLIIAYTGYMKNGKMAEIDGAGADALRKILKNNPKLEDLCVFVKSIPTNKINAINLTKIIPLGLQMLTFALCGNGTSGFFGPLHYAALVQQCPGLKGLGTTMHLADPAYHGHPFPTRNIETIMLALRNLPSLKYLSLIRFSKTKKNRFEAFVTFLRQTAHKQDIAKQALNITASDDNEFKFHIVSTFHRKISYAPADDRTFGTHYIADKQDKLIKFKPTKRKVVEIFVFSPRLLDDLWRSVRRLRD